MMLNKVSKFVLVWLSVISSGFFPLMNVRAQASTGTLSFSPTSLTFAENETKSVSIVYTGTEITAAEVHVKVGEGLQIVDFTAGTGLVFIINSPENGEVHVGKLSEGNITSGSTLFTMNVKATACGKTGQITFNQTEVLVPDVTMSFNSASYTVNCGSAAPTTAPNNPTATRVTTPSTLPKTGFISDNLDKIILASFMLSSGIGIMYFKKNANITEPEFQIVSQ